MQLVLEIADKLLVVELLVALLVDQILLLLRADRVLLDEGLGGVEEFLVDAFGAALVVRAAGVAPVAVARGYRSGRLHSLVSVFKGVLEGAHPHMRLVIGGFAGLGILIGFRWLGAVSIC